MKFLAYILTTYILFLVIKPGIVAISLQTDTEQSCCGGQCAPIQSNDHNQKKDNSEKNCNPFQVCNSCLLQVASIPFYKILPKHKISTKRYFFYKSVFSSQFASDFWQPPKIV